MTENSTNTGGADAGPALIDVDSPDERADLPADPTETEDVLEGPGEIDDEIDDEDDEEADEEPAPGTGAVSGGFGFAGLALAVVSLTTNWTSQVVVNRDQYSAEVNAGSGMTTQQQLDALANGWQTQGWWALWFAIAALLCGGGALLLPKALGRDGAPVWARAAATGAIIVGLVGVVLAVLAITGVFGGHLTAPASSS